MEGPTPVSALLHSCTLVMAGLFTLLRVQTAFSLPLLPLALISLVCLATSIFESDLKRLIAYSTVSLVSFLWLLLSLGIGHSFVWLALLHATYKSALFISFGRLIANSEHASLSSSDSKALSSVFPFLIVCAFAPVGSSYAAIKHAALSIDFSSSAVSGVVVAVSSVAAILAWQAQVRLFPATFNCRLFSPVIHDWFISGLVFTLLLISFSVLVSGGVLLDLNLVLSFAVVLHVHLKFKMNLRTPCWEALCDDNWCSYEHIWICILIPKHPLYDDSCSYFATHSHINLLFYSFATYFTSNVWNFFLSCACQSLHLRRQSRWKES